MNNLCENRFKSKVINVSECMVEKSEVIILDAVEMQRWGEHELWEQSGDVWIRTVSLTPYSYYITAANPQWTSLLNPNSVEGSFKSGLHAAIWCIASWCSCARLILHTNDAMDNEIPIKEKQDLIFKVIFTTGRHSDVVDKSMWIIKNVSFWKNRIFQQYI